MTDPDGDRQGVVVEFDAHRGLGSIRADDGAEHLFHCVEIADGTREIEVGTEVVFRPLPKFGRMEAAHVARR